MKDMQRWEKLARKELQKQSGADIKRLEAMLGPGYSKVLQTLLTRAIFQGIVASSEELKTLRAFKREILIIVESHYAP